MVSCAIEVSRSKERTLNGAGNGSQFDTSPIVISKQMSTGCSLSPTSPSTETCIEKSPSKKKRFTKGISPERIVHCDFSESLNLGTMKGWIANTFQTGFIPKYVHFISGPIISVISSWSSGRGGVLCSPSHLP